jgi:hypothetical protein
VLELIEKDDPKYTDENNLTAQSTWWKNKWTQSASIVANAVYPSTIMYRYEVVR